MPVRPKQSVEDELPTVIAAMLFSTHRWRQSQKQVSQKNGAQSKRSVGEFDLPGTSRQIDLGDAHFGSD